MDRHSGEGSGLTPKEKAEHNREQIPEKEAEKEKFKSNGFKINNKIGARALGRDIARDRMNKFDNKQRAYRKQLEQQFDKKQQDNHIPHEYEIDQHKSQIRPFLVQERERCTRIAEGLIELRIGREMKIAKAYMNEKSLESRITKIDEEQISIKNDLKKIKEEKYRLLKDKVTNSKTNTPEQMEIDKIAQKSAYKEIKKAEENLNKRKKLLILDKYKKYGKIYISKSYRSIIEGRHTIIEKGINSYQKRISAISEKIEPVSVPEEFKKKASPLDDISEPQALFAKNYGPREISLKISLMATKDLKDLADKLKTNRDANGTSSSREMHPSGTPEITPDATQTETNSHETPGTNGASSSREPDRSEISEITPDATQIDNRRISTNKTPESQELTKDDKREVSKWLKERSAWEILDRGLRVQRTELVEQHGYWRTHAYHIAQAIEKKKANFDENGKVKEGSIYSHFINNGQKKNFEEQHQEDLKHHHQALMDALDKIVNTLDTIKKIDTKLDTIKKENEKLENNDVRGLLDAVSKGGDNSDGDSTNKLLVDWGKKVYQKAREGFSGLVDIMKQKLGNNGTSSIRERTRKFNTALSVINSNIWNAIPKDRTYLTNLWQRFCFKGTNRNEDLAKAKLECRNEEVSINKRIINGESTIINEIDKISMDIERCIIHKKGFIKEIASATTGKNKPNQDSCCISEYGGGVFDGVSQGGHGAEASRMAKEFFERKLPELSDIIKREKLSQEQIEDKLKEITLEIDNEINKKINSNIYQEDRKAVTTLSVVIPIGDGKMTAVNIGDSRVYVLTKDSPLNHITTDDGPFENPYFYNDSNNSHYKFTSELYKRMEGKNLDRQEQKKIQEEVAKMDNNKIGEIKGKIKDEQRHLEKLWAEELWAKFPGEEDSEKQKEITEEDSEKQKEIRREINSLLERKSLEDMKIEFAIQCGNVIGQSLGSGEVKPNIVTFKVNPGDRVVITSDGVHDNLSSREIVNCVSTSKTAEEAAQALVKTSRERSLDQTSSRRKPDDTTAVVVECSGEVGDNIQTSDRVTVQSQTDTTSTSRSQTKHERTEASTSTQEIEEVRDDDYIEINLH